MPICIECRYPVPQLYHTSTSSKPGGSTGGGGGINHVLAGAAPNASAPATGIGQVTGAPADSHSSQRRQSHHHSHSQQSPSHTRQPSRAKGGGESARRTPAGADVRLTQCPRCKRFADKYVEHDFVVLFIDLVLVKPQVYRHLLFNRLGSDEDAFDPAITRLGTLLLLFDVYLTWSSIELLPSTLTGRSMVPQLPILAQYAFYLILCASATLAQHLTIRALSQLLLRHASPQFPSSSPIPPSRRNTPAPPTSGAATPTPGWTAGNSPVASFHASSPTQATPGGLNGATSFHLPSASHSHTHAPHLSASALLSPPSPPGPNAISTALFVSSCMQLFPILMVVWRYDDAGGQLARGVSWAVGAQNVEALRILLGATYWSAGGIVAAGAVARWLAKRIILGAMGLGSAAS